MVVYDLYEMGDNKNKTTDQGVFFFITSIPYEGTSSHKSTAITCRLGDY